MVSVPPPQGMNEVDYEAIEAAVTETVRGRWFLSEFARRNRIAETRQLLDAMARLEAAVATPAALPSADPSVRLLIQRIKEIAVQIGDVAGDMREAGVDERFVEAVHTQARAVSGMMRSATPGAALPPGAKPLAPKTLELPRVVPTPPAPPRMPRAELPAELALRAPEQRTEPDSRLAVLADLDAMPLAKKLALFT